MDKKRDTDTFSTIIPAARELGVKPRLTGRPVDRGIPPGLPPWSIRSNVTPKKTAASLEECPEAYKKEREQGTVTCSTIQYIDIIEIYRDMVSGMIDAYLSSISNQTNIVMKTLTIIATIFIPLSFIVGVYGMNFRYMPELEYRYGYFVVWGVMLTITASMLAIFRRKNWI